MYIARFVILFEHSMLHMDKYIFPAFFFILLVYYSLIMCNLLIIKLIYLICMRSYSSVLSFYSIPIG